MKTVMFVVLLYAFNSSALASETLLKESYRCEDLFGHLDRRLATLPEWRIRISISQWEKERGNLPEGVTNMPTLVFTFCKKKSPRNLQVSDVVYHILDEANTAP